LPAVVETFPLVDGRPFPTLYWLTCLRARREIGRLESDGSMDRLNERLRTDPAFAEALARAQDDYARRRDELHSLPGAGGVGGGPPDRVKCLHAHYAHFAAGGPNPVGEWVARTLGPLLREPPCVEPS
jgi:hypothetical protein